MNKPIKIIFAGTPKFAVPYLEGLFNDSDFFVAGVITQPDRPSGRQQKLTASPIKLKAQEYGINIWQPENLRKDFNILEQLKSVEADLLVVVAYGQILPQTILDLFPLGAINVHPSLLPKYRGASPIQSAILNGEEKTGISIMLMDEKMDHGPILAQEMIYLDGTETNESLHNLMAIKGVPLLIKTIKDFIDKKISGVIQNDAEATFCRPITKDSARINWTDSAKKISAQIRGFYPWPIAWTTLDDKRLKIFPPIKVVDDVNKLSGSIVVDKGKIKVQCGQGAIELSKVQLEGKNIMNCTEMTNGFKNLSEKKLK